MGVQDIDRCRDHGRSFAGILEQGPRCGSDLFRIIHTDSGARLAEVCGERFEVAGVGAEEDGSACLQRLDHILATVIDGEGKAFPNKDHGGLGIPTAEFSGGIQKKRHVGDFCSLGA